MTAVNLAFLVIWVFGAFAYGSAGLLAMRQATPVWGPPGGSTSALRTPVGRVSLVMFLVCTIWFALNASSEFAALAFGRRQGGWLELGVLSLAFVFPPLIMQLVYHETCIEGRPGKATGWWWPVVVMYAVSPALGAWVVASILGYLPRPASFGSVIGTTFGGLFTIASVYSSIIMARARRRFATAAGRNTGNAMLVLFMVTSAVFVVAALIDDRSRLIEVLDRLTRTSPLAFLVVAVYFENRFEFYDLIIKRGVQLVFMVVTFALVFRVAQPLMDRLPPGPVHAWLVAILLVPVAMALPWLARTVSGALDRLWFHRQFTAVEAVKHLLGAMQPATNEATLVAEAERRLADIFDAPIAVSLDHRPSAAEASVEVEGATPSGGRVRCAVLRDPEARRLLSEDLAMLRSLASVLGFMLETIRLQQSRQEQEQVAQDLRLQASRSELKALRAQINPHFLFNALNAIASLIHTDPARADEAVEQLAEVFRYTLRRSDTEWAPLDQELAFARAYLDVERARFGHRLTCTVDADHGTPAPLVPSMLLQTLIENAVKHGVSQTRGPGRIELVVRASAGHLVIEVRDNGPGPAAAGTGRTEGEGFGLRSIRERLAGHFGDRAQLTLARDEVGDMTVARITMPVAQVAA